MTTSLQKRDAYVPGAVEDSEYSKPLLFSTYPPEFLWAMHTYASPLAIDTKAKLEA